MSDVVNIAGIDKGDLLAALFNNSCVAGMGWIRASEGPEVMTPDQARELIQKTLGKEFAHDSARQFGQFNGRLYFDYLFGRPLKADISGDEMAPWGYDRDNGGPGTLAAIVEKLRGEQ